MTELTIPSRNRRCDRDNKLDDNLRLLLREGSGFPIGPSTLLQVLDSKVSCEGFPF